jgi:hypothetical protein
MPLSLGYKAERANFSEMSVTTYKSIRCHDPEDWNINFRHCEKLRFHKRIYFRKSRFPMYFPFTTQQQKVSSVQCYWGEGREDGERRGLGIKRCRDAHPRTKWLDGSDQDLVSCQATSSTWVSWYDRMEDSHVLFMHRGGRTDKDEDTGDTVDA